jgi:hypothetical protein
LLDLAELSRDFVVLGLLFVAEFARNLVGMRDRLDLGAAGGGDGLPFRHAQLRLQISSQVFQALHVGGGESLTFRRSGGDAHFCDLRHHGLAKGHQVSPQRIQ